VSSVDAQAIRRFQSEASDWTGRPLTVDGQLGPRTRWALAIADLPRYRRDIVRTATLEHGVVEEPLGSNRGAAVDAYLKPAGVGLGQPWCAAFVSWVLREAGCLGELRYTASAATMLRQLRPCVGEPLPGDVFGWVLRPCVGEPLPGDVFGWVNPDGTGHVGFVIGSEPRDIITCEGNSRHGVRVNRRPREGLMFCRVEQPLVLVAAEVPGLPLTVRTEATR
jgi:hypothetical protein